MSSIGSNFGNPYVSSIGNQPTYPAQAAGTGDGSDPLAFPPSTPNNLTELDKMKMELMKSIIEDKSSTKALAAEEKPEAEASQSASGGGGGGGGNIIGSILGMFGLGGSGGGGKGILG